MILKNSVKCLKCLDEIESKSVHDYRWCKCENVAVGGGKSYLRRAYKTNEWAETSVETNEAS